MVFSVMMFSTIRSASRVRIVPVTRIQETVARDLHGACDLHACGLHTARDVQEVSGRPSSGTESWIGTESWMGTESWIGGMLDRPRLAALGLSLVKSTYCRCSLSRSAWPPRCSTPYSEPTDKLATHTCEYFKTHRYPFIRRPGCRPRIVNASRTFVCGRLDGRERIERRSRSWGLPQESRIKRGRRCRRWGRRRTS